LAGSRRVRDKEEAIVQTIVAIPARLASTRFPRKLLAPLRGRPVLWHAWNQARRASGVDRVVLLTDAEEMRQVAAHWPAEVLLTSSDCRSGTERIASVLDQLEADVIVNLQGDEPLVEPALVEQLAARCGEDDAEIVTPVFRIQRTEQLADPNIVKVARACDGRAVYFSRHPVPFLRDVPRERWLDSESYWGHVGMYAYRRATLARYHELPESRLEEAERLEQLRFLEAGCRILTIETDYHPIGIDVPADLQSVESLLSGREE